MSIPIETADNFEYIHRPLTQARREKFRRVCAKVRGGRVLDLGSGYTGHYWALGYLSRAQSISFYDAVEENVALQRQTIDQLSPEYISSYLHPTVQFLKEEHLLPTEWSNEQIATDLLSKVETIEVFDFARDTAATMFDTVLALESIEIAESVEELHRSVATARSLCRVGGQFVGLALPYTELLPTTSEAIALRREGRLNPGLEELREAITRSGFRLVGLETYETGTPNYPQGIVFDAEAV